MLKVRIKFKIGGAVGALHTACMQTYAVVSRNEAGYFPGKNGSKWVVFVITFRRPVS